MVVETDVNERSYPNRVYLVYVLLLLHQETALSMLWFVLAVCGWSSELVVCFVRQERKLSGWKFEHWVASVVVHTVDWVQDRCRHAE